MSKFQFRPTSMTVNCPVLKKLTLYGVSTLAGSLDLANAPKLEEMDLRGTGLSSVLFPETETLKKAYLPALNNIKIVNCPNLNTISFASLSNLLSLTTDRSQLVLDAFRDATNLTEIHLYNIDITASDTATSNTIYNALVSENSTCTGKVAINKQLTLAEKNALITKYSNTDNPNGALYITYTVVPGTSSSISAPEKSAWGDHFNVTLSYNGNDIQAYNWEITGAAAYTASFCNASVTTPDEGETPIVIKCTITKIDGTTEIVQKSVQVIEPIAITSMSVPDLEMNSSTDNILHIAYSPANYTIDPDIITVEMAANEYVAVQSNTKDTVSFRLKKANETSVVVPIDIIINMKDVELNEFTDSATIYVTNPATGFKIDNIELEKIS